MLMTSAVTRKSSVFYVYEIETIRNLICEINNKKQ